MPRIGECGGRSFAHNRLMNAALPDRRVAGVISLVVGVMVFSTQDAIIKSISGDYALTQVIVIRCFVAMPILAFLVHFETGLRKLSTPHFHALVIRGLVMLAAYTAYYLAFPSIPLAEAIALFFTAPIIVTILAGPILGERVNLRSWFAVAIGFAGVLTILQPGSALFEPAALLSLISAATYATSMVFTRRLGIFEPATVISFYQNAVYLAGAGLMAIGSLALGVKGNGDPSLDFLLRPWITPSLRDALLMGACGVIAAVAMSLLIQAYRLAEANLVTVYEYTGMIWAPLWGFLFFSEIPRWTTFLGMALIMAAGISAFGTRPPTRRKHRRPQADPG
jgi:drug/metabolite transporter (DMT)-like permease